MRIVLDARPFSHPQAGGFRTYVRALLQGLRERAAENNGRPDHELLVYVDRPLAPEAEACLPPGATVRVLSPERLRTDLRLFAAQVKADAPDLVHGTMNYLPGLPASVPTTLTLHDAMGIKRYDWDARTPRTPRERFVNRYWAYRTQTSALRARRIVTVSRGAANEIADALRLPPERLRVVYNGLVMPTPCPEGPRDADAVLAIESPDPRKNLAMLYRALNEPALASRPPRLRVVCNGAVAEARTAAALLPLSGRVPCETLTGLSDQQLADAYARAAVFVWPSRLEGFGLPPLEAMRCGCPVVASSAPAMPEVLGDAPLYAAPDDPAGFAAAVARLLSDPAEREERGRLGRAQAAAFTCRRMADETVAVWREALG